jgi:8-oxo-dGTP diphosphatase
MAVNLEKYPKPAVAVDIVVFSIISDELKILLIKRGQQPFTDMWSLPGGFVRIHEPLENAALRELEEETGIKDVYLEQLYTFGDPKRDPRGRVISVVYFALLDSTKIKPYKTGEEEIIDVQWVNIEEIPHNLAFDHDEIIKYALKRLRYKLEYSSIGLELLPSLFTLAEMQKLYEIILNEKLDKRNFRKKTLSMNIIEPTKQYKTGQHRPALLYRLKKTGTQPKFKRVKFEG